MMDKSQESDIFAVNRSDDRRGPVGHGHVVLDGFLNPEPGGQGAKNRPADRAGADWLITKLNIDLGHLLSIPPNLQAERRFEIMASADCQPILLGGSGVISGLPTGQPESCAPSAGQLTDSSGTQSHLGELL